MKNKQIPKKNYIILSIIVIITIVLTLLARNTYLEYKKANEKNSVMANFLVVLNEEEFKNYALENQNAIIYFSDSKDETKNNFEEELKKLISQAGIENQMLFLNYTKMDNKKINNFKNKYFDEGQKEKNIGQFTNIFIMENGKITTVLYDEKKEINIDDVIDLFTSKGIIAQA